MLQKFKPITALPDKQNVRLKKRKKEPTETRTKTTNPKIEKIITT